MLKTSELPKWSKKSSLNGSGASSKKKMFPETTTDNIFEKKSSFHVKLHTTGKIQFLFSIIESFANIDKIFFLGGRLGTRL